jgi:hypothetical protein
MKIKILSLFVFFVALGTTTALAQGGAVLSNQPQVIEPSSHPQHADIHDLATEQSLVGGGSVTYAHGERPLWEFGSPYPEPAPLGDVARAYRKEKMTAKKAEKVLEKQGS